MRNPEVTREKILKQSGVLFNTQGYKATSLSDITTATGLTKGAIYRHFDNKDELEMESLSYLSSIMFTTLKQRIQAESTAPNKLRSICQYYKNYLFSPEVQGGCPLLNAAIEADDNNPALRGRAVSILDMLHQSLVSIFNNGIKYGQLKSYTDVDYYSTLFIANLEGAIMMSKLRGNAQDINRVILHLERLITEIEQ